MRTMNKQFSHYTKTVLSHKCTATWKNRRRFAQDLADDIYLRRSTAAGEFQQRGDNVVREVRRFP